MNSDSIVISHLFHFVFFLLLLKLNSSGGGYAMDEAGFDEYDGVEDESDDEDDAESSVDLLIRFLQSMFKKVSKRAKKASRSVLPTVISPQLVSAPFFNAFKSSNFFSLIFVATKLMNYGSG